MSGTIYVRGSDSGGWIASIAEVPGCMARGVTREDAAANVGRAFGEYVGLLKRYGVSTEHWDGLDPDRFVVKEPPEDRLVAEDDRPLEEHEIRDFLHQMEGQRSALLALVHGMSADEMERKPTPDMWSVREALEHIMTTEALYLSRMERWPGHDLATLQAVHRMTFQRFSVLEPEDTHGSHRVFDQRWSTRRVMRRILEHEFEHLQHIKEILAELGGDRQPS